MSIQTYLATVYSHCAGRMQRMNAGKGLCGGEMFERWGCEFTEGLGLGLILYCFLDLDCQPLIWPGGTYWASTKYCMHQLRPICGQIKWKEAALGRPRSNTPSFWGPWHIFGKADTGRGYWWWFGGGRMCARHAIVQVKVILRAGPCRPISSPSFARPKSYLAS